MEYHESDVIGLGEGDEGVSPEWHRGGRARGRVRVHPKQRRATCSERGKGPGAEVLLEDFCGPSDLKRLKGTVHEVLH